MSQPNAGGPPPMPRIMCPAPQSHDHCMTIAKVPARKYYWDAELLVSTQMAVQRWYGFDGYFVLSDAYNNEIEALGQAFIYSDNAMPTPDVHRPLISKPSDLAKLKPLDLSRARIPMGIEVAKLIIEKAPGPLSGGMVCAPFSMLCGLMGYPAAIRAMRREPQFARDLFAYTEEEVIKPYIEAQVKQAGAKVILGADAWSAFPNLSLPMAREWILPSVRRFDDWAKPRGLNTRIGMLVADYCEEDPAKFDKQIMFDCFDVGNQASVMGMPIVFGGMGATHLWNPHWLQEYAISHAGPPMGKLMIYMSLNGRFVRDSKPEAIVEKMREWIDVMGRDGVAAISTANVPADTNPLNVQTVIAAVRTLGHDPIPTDLSKVKVEIPKFKPFDEWLKGQPEEEVIRKAREK